MSSGLSIRMTKTDLLAAIRERRAQVVAEHEDALKRYEGELVAWRKRITVELDKLGEAIADGKMPKTVDGRYIRLSERLRPPEKPVLGTRKYDRDIAWLTRAAQTDFRLTRDAFEAYVR
jgi:hypothetical protein